MAYDLKTAYRHHRRTRAPGVALAMARDDAAAMKPRYASAPSKLGAYARKAGTYDSAFMETLESGGFRLVGYADEILSRLHHTGWFTNEFQDSTYRGAVLQVSGAKGRPRYVAGYAESDSGGYVVDLSRGAIFTGDAGDEYTGTRDLDSAHDAARAADNFARRAAEKESEYQAAWQAGNAWASLGDDVKAARRVALQILRERRAVTGVEAPALCAAIVSRVRQLVDQIEEARAKRRALVDSVWRQHFEAFNEGAGDSVLA